jgi:hypothetical protein
MSQEQPDGHVRLEGKYGILTHSTLMLKKELFLPSGIE